MGAPGELVDGDVLRRVVGELLEDGVERLVRVALLAGNGMVDELLLAAVAVRRHAARPPGRNVPRWPHVPRYRTSMPPPGRLRIKRMSSANSSTDLPCTGQRTVNMGPILRSRVPLDEWQERRATMTSCHERACERIDPHRAVRDHVVAALVYEDLAFFELAVAVEVFGLRRPELGVDWYDFRVCSARPGPVTTTGGVQVQAPYRLRTLARADTVIVPGWHPIEEEPADEVLAAIRAAHARGARVLSVCSGAFVLAAAGLLDGRTATTHWMFADELARRYPAVTVDPSVLYIDDGDVMTTAGTAAGIDLCLHVVRLDYGAEVANVVARRMVVPPHRDGGQAQYVAAPVPACSDEDPLAATLAWAIEHLDEDLTVKRLAEVAHESPRTFARRFRDATGTTPLQWVIAQRIVLAQRLLETTDLAVDQIAARCGFGSGPAFRVHFSRKLGTSPQAYRRQFRHGMAEAS